MMTRTNDEKERKGKNARGHFLKLNIDVITYDVGVFLRHSIYRVEDHH